MRQIFNFFRLATLPIVAFVLLTPAAAIAYDLVCDISGYDARGKAQGLAELVPPHAVFTIDDDTATMPGVKGRIKVDDTGSQILIHYLGRLDEAGETEANFTFFRSNGSLVVRTKGHKSFQWTDEYPDRTGQYSLRGACVEQ